MSKRTLLLILALLATAGILIYVALQPQKPKPQAPTIYPTPTPIAQSQLMFGPLTSSVSTLSGKLTYSLPVLISTNTNKVTAIQLELSYDSNILGNVKVMPDTFLGNPIILLNKVDQKNGHISYALGISPQDSGKMGQGQVATLTFESLVQAPVQTTIQFLPKSLITAEGVTQSVLAQTTPIQITVGK